MSSEASVYTGQWINWADGSVVGSTVTITSQNGAYLIAFLALFVRVAGQHLWDILCYIFFQSRATTKPRDGLHHEQQAILRNTLTDTSAAWQFLRLGWYWRGRANKIARRTIPLVVFSMLHIIAFAVAGIFVSRLVNSHSQVLLRGPTCGWWSNPIASPTDIDSTAAKALLLEQTLWSARRQAVLRASAEFVESCYNTSSTEAGLANCEAYGPRQMSWTTETNVSCPFAKEMCRGDTVVRFDSGLLDSQLVFGINAHKKDRIKYRQVLECAPITQEAFSTALLSASEADLPPPEIMETPKQPWEGFQEFNYGPNWAQHMNSTFIASNLSFGLPTENIEQLGYLVE